MIMSADYMDIRREERQISEARGEARSTERIARKLLYRGDDEASVMEVTGLTQDQIDAILGRKQDTL